MSVSSGKGDMDEELGSIVAVEGDGLWEDILWAWSE